MDNFAVAESIETSKENLLKSSEYLSAEGELIVPIGTADSGEIIVQDLYTVPHLLVCGFSGAGKTSFVQTIITSLAVRYPSSKVKFYIYDSKAIDYGIFNSMPHLQGKVFTSTSEVISALSYVTTEMKRRYKLFSAKGVKDVVGYNKTCSNDGTEEIPSIFIVLDDFSALDVHYDLISAILKDGRIVGVHLIIVTSMTSSKYLPKDVISNVPCRITFCVSSRADSRMAIEINGAENLNVPGELIFRWQNRLAKCQAAYIQYEDIQKAIKQLHAKDFSSISKLGNLAAGIFSDDQNIAEAKEEAASEYDELLNLAAEVIFDMRSASVSMIQRRLKLGYSRAARMVDQLEQLGLVGEYAGATPREVLLSREEWNAVCKRKGLPFTVPSDSTKSTYTPTNSSVNKASAKRATPDDEPDIPLRDFPEFSTGENSMGVSDNHVHLKFKVMTRLGSGTASPTFNGNSIAALIYKSPSLFSKGYIQFKMKPKVDVQNQNPYLLDVTQANVSDFLKIEFASPSAKITKLFMKQIAEDIGIQLTEL